MRGVFLYKIKYVGLNFQNFLNILIKHNIEVLNISKSDNVVGEFFISPKQYKRLKKVYLIDNLKIEKVGGIKYLLMQSLRRVGVIVGTLAIVISSIILSNKTLYIKILGATDSINEIEKVINEYGIVVGKRNNIDTQKLEKYLIDNIDNLSLVSIKNKGSVLVVNVVEKENTSSNEFQPFYSPYNMVIKKVNLISGTLCIDKNDVVKKGDILVDSYIINSNGEKISVEASARIEADVWFCESEVEYKEKVEYVKTGNISTKTQLKTNSNKVDIMSPYNNYVTETYIINVTNNKFLPIYLHKTIFYETQEKIINFNFEKYKDIYFEKSKQKAYEILPSNVIIDEEIQRLSNSGDKYIFQTYLKATMEITNEN